MSFVARGASVDRRAGFDAEREGGLPAAGGDERGAAEERAGAEQKPAPAGRASDQTREAAVVAGVVEVPGLERFLQAGQRLVVGVVEVGGEVSDLVLGDR